MCEDSCQIAEVSYEDSEAYVGDIELRRYLLEVRNEETGMCDFVVEKTVSGSRSIVEHLAIPDEFNCPDDDCSDYQWVFVGNRCDRMRGLGLSM